MMGFKNYSKHIYRLKEYLNLMGCEVVFDATLSDKSVGDNYLLGQCQYSKKRIVIGDIPEAKTALMTLLHEGGHWISSLEYKDKMKTHKNFTGKKFLQKQRLRERWAKKFGIETIRRLHIPITIREYEKFDTAD